MQRKSSGQKKMFCQADSRPAVLRGVSGNHLHDFSGNLAALRAGRRLADPRDVEAAVLRAALEFMALPDRTAAASARMRATVVPFLHASRVTP